MATKLNTVGFSTTKAGDMENAYNKYVSSLKTKLNDIEVKRNKFRNAVHGDNTYAEFNQFIDATTKEVRDLLAKLGNHAATFKNVKNIYKRDADKLFK